jgi:transmembrane sensor
MSIKRKTRESPRQRERRIRAEAAVWFARRHGSDRTAATEAGWRRWLSEDAAHEAEYKIVVDLWNDPTQCVRKSTRPGIERPVLATVTVVLALAVLVGVFHWIPTTLSTGIGGRLSRILADGTQIELNTDTHIAVRYRARQREIDLQSGEIYLNVIKHEPRPFVVVAGDRKVVATGTSFVVRRDDSSVTPLTVTLVEGYVMITPADTRDSSRAQGTYRTIILNAGERARFRHDGPPMVDKPSIDKVTSWKDGELTFADTPLIEAVQEFNRYSVNRITVRSPEAESILVNGVFRTEDSLSFIRTVAEKQHMSLQVQGDELILESARSGSSGKEENSLN